MRRHQISGRMIPMLALAGLSALSTTGSPAGSSGTVALPAGPLFPTPIFDVGRQPVWVTTGDFNGDGNVDLVTANLGYSQPGGSLTGGDISVLPGRGDGTFADQTHLAAGAAPVFVLALRLDADARDDLVVVNRDSNDISILLGNGDGTFGAQTRFVAGSRPGWAGAADFNRDGNVDLAVLDTGSAAVAILLGDGRGGFSYRTPISVERAVWAANGDFNDDGNADLAVLALGPPICPPDQSCYNGPSRITVVLGGGDGTFATVVGFDGTFARRMAAGNLNGDGATDVVLSDSAGGGLSVLLANTDGTFSQSASFPSYASVAVPLVGDLDGDGKNDVALPSDPHDYTRPPAVSVYLGNGDGTLGAESRYRALFFPFSIALADLNGDGAGDIAVADQVIPGQVPGKVFVLLGRGDGSLLTGIRFDAAPEPRARLGRFLQ